MNWISLILVFMLFGCGSTSNRNDQLAEGHNNSNDPVPYDRHLCSYNKPTGSVPANAGHIKSCQGKNRNCFQAGLYLERTGHFTEAQSTFQKACDQKNLESCYCLGQSMMTDQKPETEITKVFTNACEAGHQDSCSFVHKSLYITNKDPAAFDRLQKDCSKGIIKACYFKAMIDQQNGDLQSAEKLYKKACTKKIGYACGDLTQIYVSKEDYQNAEVYKKKACTLGITEYCDFLPMYSESWIKPHVEFCKQGFFESCMVAMKSNNKSIVERARKVARKFDTVICNRNRELTKEEFEKKYAELKKNSLGCVSETNLKISSKKTTQSFDISRCVR